MCKSCHVRVRQLRRQAKLFTGYRGWQNFNLGDPVKMGTPGSHFQLNWEPHLEAADPPKVSYIQISACLEPVLQMWKKASSY